MGSFRFFRAAAGSLVVSVGALSPVVGLRNRYKHRRWLRSLRFSRPPFSVLALPSSFVCPSRVPSIVVFRSTDSCFGAPQNRYKYRRWLRSLRFRRAGGFVHHIVASLVLRFQPSVLLPPWLRSSRFHTPRWLRSTHLPRFNSRHLVTCNRQRTTDNGQRTTDERDFPTVA